NKEGALSSVTKDGQAITSAAISQAQADYDAALAVYQNKKQDVQNYQINLSASGTDLAMKTSTKDTAQASLNSATQAFNNAQSAKDIKQTAYTKAYNDYLAAKTTCDSADIALNNAKALETTTSQALTTAQNTSNAKQATLNTKIAARQALQAALANLNAKIQTDQASLAQTQQSLTQALAEEQTAQTKYNNAQTNLNARQSAYNSAVQDRQAKKAAFNTANAALTAKTSVKNQADTVLQAAIQALTSAQSAKDTKQAAYNSAYTLYLSSQTVYNQALTTLNNAQADETAVKNKTDLLSSALNTLLSIPSLFPSQDIILANADKKLDIISVLYDPEKRIKTVHSIDGTTQNYTEGLPNDISLNTMNYLTIDRDGIKRIYDEYGNLSSITANGISTTLNNGQVTRIEKEDGTVIENAVFDSNNNIKGGKITTVDGVQATYSDGVLTEAKEPDKGVTYSYLTVTESGKIFTAANAEYPDNITESEEAVYQKYDSDKRLVQVRRKNGDILNYTYTFGTSGDVAFTCVSDGKTITTYDENNNIKKTEVLPTSDAPVSTISEYEYDRIRRVYKGGVLVYRYNYEFDDAGKEMTVIEDVKTGDFKRYKDELLISVTDKDSLVTSYEYDSEKRIAVSIITYLGKTMNRYTYSYESENTIIEDIDGVKRTYNKDDKLIFLEESGKTYAYTYNIGSDGKEETVQELIKVKDDTGSIAVYEKGVLKIITKSDGSVLSDFVIVGDKVQSYSMLKDGIKYFVVNEHIEKIIKKDGSMAEYYDTGFVKSILGLDGKIMNYDYLSYAEYILTG
ncbi:MAG: hypothetical protein NTY47_06180, partial [Candidatus Omnitrophica bacterium]|nr:hypothetical protein [Candidatus Omnitrophota bacterium]